MGHTLGAWSLIEPDRAPKMTPFPGMLAMQTPLVFYDSVSVSCGEGAPWMGFGASLATATGHSRRMAKPSDARTVIDLRNGDFAFDENALMIERGDSSGWVRGEVVSSGRSLVEGFDASGRHLWGVSGGRDRGRHALLGTFVQRGSAFAMVSQDEQGAAGESGSLEYRMRARGVDAGLRLERGYDHHESFNLGVPELRPFSRREAQEDAAIGDARFRSGLGDVAVKVDVRRALVTRRGGNEFERSATSAWGAVRIEHALGDGAIHLEVGGGRHSWTKSDLAPAISYRLETPSFGGRLGFERVLVPVWSDLAPGETPFLQRTWVGVIEAELRPRSATHARATFLFGRTIDRALLNRLPMEELWLRFGARAEPDPYDFGILMLESVWTGARFAAGANGYSMGSDQNFAQPLVDPKFGFRGWGAWRFSAFSGDLGVTLRAELDGVGDRETEGELTDLTGETETAPSKTLPSYLTSGFTAMITLSGATLTIRARNLEDRRREQIWFDPATVAEALGPGRELRFALTIRLNN